MKYVDICYHAHVEHPWPPEYSKSLSTSSLCRADVCNSGSKLQFDEIGMY